MTDPLRSLMSVMITLVASFGCGGESSEGDEASAPTSPLIEFRLAHDHPSHELEPVEYDGDTLYLQPHPLVSDEDFLAVRSTVRGDQLLLDIDLTVAGAQRLRSGTEQATGVRLALLLDSQLRSAPVIRQPIGGAAVPLTAAVSLSEDEATRMIEAVRARWPTVTDEAR